MKKIIAILALAIGLQIGTIQNANAGFIFYTGLTIKTVVDRDFPLLVDAGLIALNGVVAKGAIKLYEFMMSSVPTARPEFGIYGSVFIILSTDEMKQKSAMTAELTKRYQFINDQSIIEELSDALIEEFNKSNKADEELIEVKLAEESTRSILKRTDLSDKDIETIINDLR